MTEESSQAITESESPALGVRWVPQSGNRSHLQTLQQGWRIWTYRNGELVGWRDEWRDVPLITSPAKDEETAILGDIRDDGAILTKTWGWRDSGEIWIPSASLDAAKAHGWAEVERHGDLIRVTK